MQDFIHIRDLLLRTILGVNDDERVNRQDVLINLTLSVDLRAAGRSDDIRDAVNYRTITKQVIEHIENSRYLLVEKMAHQVASLCLNADGRIDAVEVSIEKPTALRFARSVGVTITRTRDDV